MGTIVQLNKYSTKGFKRGRPKWCELLWITTQAILISSWLPGSIHRIALLRLFGAKIGHGVVIKPGVKIKFPWRLSVGDNTWIGENVWLDSLDKISIASNVCVSQGAYLCTGNHDWNDPYFGLILKPIYVEEGVWVGANATVLPGVRLAIHSVLVAGSVISKDTEENGIYQGNPAKMIKKREIRQTYF